MARGYWCLPKAPSQTLVGGVVHVPVIIIIIIIIIIVIIIIIIIIIILKLIS